MLRRFFPGRQTPEEDASRFTTVNPMTASFPRAQAGPGAEGSAAAEAEDLSARAPSAGLAARLIGNPAFGRSFGPAPPIPSRFAPAAAAVAAATTEEYDDEDLGRDMFSNERGEIVYPRETAAAPRDPSTMSLDDRIREFQNNWASMPTENRDMVKAFFTYGYELFGRSVSFVGNPSGAVELIIADEDNDEASVDDPSGQAQAIARQQGQADDMAEDPTGAGKRALLNRRRQELMALKHRR